MNTNVSDMPLEIFADYTSDMLDQEWHWEYLFPIINGNHNPYFEEFGNSDFVFGWYSGNGRHHSFVYDDPDTDATDNAQGGSNHAYGGAFVGDAGYGFGEYDNNYHPEDTDEEEY